MSEEKKKQTGKNRKRAYLDDFKLQESGEYAYEGTLYVYKGDWKACRKQLWTLCGVLSALVVAAGIIPSGGMMNTFYVILPYVGELTVLAIFLYGVLRFTSRDEKIRAYIYEKTYERFNAYFMFLFSFSAMCVIGEIIHMVFVRPVERVGFTLLYMTVQVFAFGITSVLNRHVQAMTFEKVKAK